MTIPDISLSNLKAGDKVEPKQLATKVQAMFMEVMLKSMEDSVEAEDGLFGSSASSEIYRGMLREQLATSISGKMDSPLSDQLNHILSKPAASPASDSGLPVSGVISSPEGWRHDPINGEMRYHAGTDIA